MTGAAPDWLIALCHDHGLVTPGAKPRVWKLNVMGMQVWRLLMCVQKRQAK